MFLLTPYANVTFSWWIEDGCCHWAEVSVAMETYPVPGKDWVRESMYFGGDNMLGASRQLQSAHKYVCVDVSQAPAGFSDWL